MWGGLPRGECEMQNDDCYLQEFGYERFERVADMFTGKWRLRILYMLAVHGVLRYGELKKLILPITHKMLTSQLRELERLHLVNRKEYSQIPPKVEYSLTEMGRDLQKVAEKMYEWSTKYNL